MGRSAPKRPSGAAARTKVVPRGQAHIHATFNNTLVTITDMTGNPIAWGSAGTAGFKGSRKSTPYAAQMSAEGAARRAMDHGMQTVDVYVKGPGPGRESAIRALQSTGLECAFDHRCHAGAA